MHFCDFCVFFTLKIAIMIYRYHLLSIHHNRCVREVLILCLFYGLENWGQIIYPIPKQELQPSSGSIVHGVWFDLFFFFSFFVIVLLGYKIIVKGMYQLLILSRNLVIFDYN